MTDKITSPAEAIEAAARVVDQANREGPYNAIGAAARIRALSEWIQPAVTCAKTAAIEEAYGLLWNVPIDIRDPRDAAISAARKALMDVLSRDEQARGIRAAMNNPVAQAAKRGRR